MLVLVSLAWADYDPQYVSSTNGDTLFVKDDGDFGSGNTLTLLMRSDSLAPEGRVYFLKASGTYSCANNPASSKNYKTVIMGPEQNIKTGTILPPVVSGMYTTDVNSNGGMNCNKELLVKNIDLEIGNSNGNGGGWAFFNFSGADQKLQVDNCIMEHTWWTWVGGPPAGTSVIFTNDYMVNLGGQSCRRNGGVTDFNSGSALNQKLLQVENCTHVNIQGMIYKFRAGYTVDKVIFNHNNFVNCSRDVIMSDGTQTNLSITNSIFVNCQLQPFSNSLRYNDAGEIDVRLQPMGLVNLRVDSIFTANVGTHGVYVDKNLAYWDPSLSDIVTIANTAPGINNFTDWVSQMITMNAGTAALFADDATYPKLYNGAWINKLPAFANTDNLFSSALATLKTFSLATVDTTFAAPLTSWRQASNPEATNFVYADFPIPIDLSYTDADLLNAGFGGFPIGDLGWFPTQKAAWEAQKAAELTAIQNSVDTGIPISGGTGVATTQVPNGFRMEQNYPNPFNPSTDISYTIAKAGNVTLKVYNMLGQDIATLVNGFQTANTYKVNFNASGLSSGVYFYKLSTGSNEMIKKMVLMK
jgi:hypothetical protein